MTFLIFIGPLTGYSTFRFVVLLIEEGSGALVNRRAARRRQTNDAPLTPRPNLQRRHLFKLKFNMELFNTGRYLKIKRGL